MGLKQIHDDSDVLNCQRAMRVCKWWSFIYPEGAETTAGYFIQWDVFTGPDKPMRTERNETHEF